MTGRRGTLIETGAMEQLRSLGWTVTLVPPGYCRHYPPVHLIAELQGHGRRLIRIRKDCHRPASADTLAMDHPADIRWFRRYLARHAGEPGLHCELWVYQLSYGFRCFEILPGSFREIHKPLPGDADLLLGRGCS